MAVTLALPAASVGNPQLSANTSDVMVCVDWVTKEVKFSKYWEECPSKHAELILGTQGPQGEQGSQGERGPSGPRGARGPSGATTSLWDSLPTCYTKLRAAIDVGLLMALKSDRDYFEGVTGCVVEKIRDESEMSLYENMGYPYISDWEYVGPAFGGDGGAFLGFDTYASQAGTFNFTIENGDALSAVNDAFRFCFRNYLGQPKQLRHLGGKIYTSDNVSLYATPLEFTAKITLGYQIDEWNWGECTHFNYFEEVSDIEVDNARDAHSVHGIVIHLDPATAPATFANFKSYWGWD